MSNVRLHKQKELLRNKPDFSGVEAQMEYIEEANQVSSVINTSNTQLIFKKPAQDAIDINDRLTLIGNVYYTGTTNTNAMSNDGCYKMFDEIAICNGNVKNQNIVYNHDDFIVWDQLVDVYRPMDDTRIEKQHTFRESGVNWYCDQVNQRKLAMRLAPPYIKGGFQNIFQYALPADKLDKPLITMKLNKTNTSSILGPDVSSFTIMEPRLRHITKIDNVDNELTDIVEEQSQQELTHLKVVSHEESFVAGKSSHIFTIDINADDAMTLMFYDFSVANFTSGGKNLYSDGSLRENLQIYDFEMFNGKNRLLSNDKLDLRDTSDTREWCYDTAFGINQEKKHYSNANNSALSIGTSAPFVIPLTYNINSTGGVDFSSTGKLKIKFKTNVPLANPTLLKCFILTRETVEIEDGVFTETQIEE